LSERGAVAVDLVQKVLNLLLARRYQVTDHALESMDHDALSLNDVVSCLSKGRLRRSWRRQRKHEIEGRSIDGRRMRVVIRLIEPRFVRIITLYEIQSSKTD
jgi:hypothetical protein